jgi:hypothetical protein
MRSILTEIYLCHACSCHELLRMETPGQVNFTETDVLPSLCAAVNQQAWEWALASAGDTARERFQRRGIPLVMANDTFIGECVPAMA